MAQIDVSLVPNGPEANPKKYKVQVKEDGSKSQHLVALSDEYYQRLTGGLRSREDLIKASFKFLLERDRKKKYYLALIYFKFRSFFRSLNT